MKDELDEIASLMLPDREHNYKVLQGVTNEWGLPEAREVDPQEVLDLDTKVSPGDESAYDIEDLSEYKWTREKVPVNKLFHKDMIDLWTPDMPMWNESESKPEPGEISGDEEYAQMYSKKKTKAPPILVSKEGGRYRILSGRHRSRAAFLRGEKTIDAYVGVKR